MLNSKKVLPNVLLLNFKTQKDLTLSMCRMQEYYEASNKQLWHKKFTWATFLDVMTDEQGHLSYFSFWKGFNLPGHIFLKFFKLFAKDLSPKEKKIYQIVKTKMDIKKKFYIIAYSQPDLKSSSNSASDSKKKLFDVFAHEMAHALYYLVPNYKSKANLLTKTMDKGSKEKMTQKLLKMGYGKSVIPDEIQAYLSTTPPKQLQGIFGLRQNEFLKLTKKFQNNLKSYLKL